MSKDGKAPSDLASMISLTEAVHLSGDVAFWTVSVSVSLKYPVPDGGLQTLAALSGKAAERARLLHAHLKTALEERDRKSGENP